MKSRPPENDAVWKALADPTRRAILDALAEGPLLTGQIVARFDRFCRTAVMKHLEILVAAELVVVRRQGRQRWNYLNPVPIQQVCDRWVSRHVRQMASALVRLKQFVEQQPDAGKSTPGRPKRRPKKGAKA